MNCVSGTPSYLGTPQRSKILAKQSAAEAALDSPNFDALIAAAEAARAAVGSDVAAEDSDVEGAGDAAPKTQRKKKPRKKKTRQGENDTAVIASAPSKIAVADLEVGQTLDGVVSKLTPRGAGAWIDVGAEKDGFLSAAEYRDGFPTGMYSDVKRGQKVSVKVLAKDEETFTVTRRSGDVTRPLVTKSDASRKWDVEPFKAVAHNDWLEGQVLGMTTWGLWVGVPPPGGGELVEGLVHKGDLKEGYEDKAALGDVVKVRVRYADTKSGRLVCSMKEPIVGTVSELQVGQELEGRVVIYLRNGVGAIVDVGADKNGIWRASEYRDGVPLNELKPDFGTSLQLRVLSIDGDNFELTNRTGDLTRPPWDTTVFVLVKPPDGSSPVRALLDKRDFTKAFVDEARPGGKVRVRVTSVDEEKKLVVVSMLTEAEREEALAAEAAEKKALAAKAADKAATRRTKQRKSAPAPAPPPTTEEEKEMVAAAEAVAPAAPMEAEAEAEAPPKAEVEAPPKAEAEAPPEAEAPLKAEEEAPIKAEAEAPPKKDPHVFDGLKDLLTR
eukprot:CAMPEP_0180807116 /NCGR_PEP_ID=MMETSP1038_2-20121128/63053_1 /TAXON_ID=632150 /ORGANISM="Azadinium spinosum, Strain 3D9" /LENGTH=553 /DNA_ID=CAMNT_0022848065 /DNA_START=9 /DNA_END=1670 /DNA_ORIENTATION=-